MDLTYFLLLPSNQKYFQLINDSLQLELVFQMHMKKPLIQRQRKYQSLRFLLIQMVSTHCRPRLRVVRPQKARNPLSQAQTTKMM